MSTTFQPNLSILQAPQRRLWDELAEVPEEFVLCGGTAVALHLGHRVSVDYDLFGSRHFDPDKLFGLIGFLKGSQVIQKSENTLTCLVNIEGPTKISFFGVPNLRRIREPLVAADNGLQVASLIDLAGMKAAVVQKRAEAKDYKDIDAMLTQGGVDLPTALSAAKAIYGDSFNPELTLKSLSFFGDGDLATLPEAVQRRLMAAVTTVDLDQLPKID